VRRGASICGTCPTPSSRCSVQSGLQRGELRHAGDGHQPVELALQHDAGHPHGGEQLAVGGGAGDEHRQRPGRLEERLLAVGTVGALLAELDGQPAHLRRHLRHVGAGQLERRLHEGLGAEAGPAAGQRALGDTGHGEQRHLLGERASGDGLSAAGAAPGR
jgi:hypothetical protein